MHVFVFSVFCAVSCVSSSVTLKQKAPNGGYRLEAQESRNDESEQYSPHPPPLRTLEQDSTETRIKSPLSYQVPDNTPWRPMVSESTSRIHKTSFGKGFKYHSFADPKSESEHDQNDAEPSVYGSDQEHAHPQFIFSNFGAGPNGHRHHHHHDPHQYRDQHPEQPQNPYQPDSRQKSYFRNNPFTAKPEHTTETRAPEYLQTQTAESQPEHQNIGGVRYVYVQDPSGKRDDVRDPQRHYASYQRGMPPQHEHHGQQQTKEEEPSDDVLLSHVPLPKAKIAVQMHDDAEPAPGPPENHNYPDQHTEQVNAGNSGPMYQMVTQEDHNSASKENLAVDRGQQLDFEFQPHFTKHVPQRHVHPVPPPARIAEIRTTGAQSQRAPRQFTIKASPLQVPSQPFGQPRQHQEPARTLASHFGPSQIFSLPQHYEAVLPTPPALRTTFQKASLHHEPHPKPFYMPLMFPSISNEPRDHRIFRLPQTKSFAQATFPYLASSGGSNANAGLGRMPLTRDIQAYIRKKKAAA